MNRAHYDSCVLETVAYFKSIGKNFSADEVRKIVPFVSAKTVLVICSDNEGIDYPKDANQIMLKSLLGDNFTPVFMDKYPKGQYPGDLPEGQKFDAVLFAGCNLMRWLFYDDYEAGMKKLSKLLNKNGIVIFIENANYIKHVVDPGQSYELSIPLDEMKIEAFEKYDTNGVKKEMLKSWGKFFQLTRINNYFVYTKKSSKSK